MEFKSKQWFGASVRSDGEHILVMTPRVHGALFDSDHVFICSHFCVSLPVLCFAGLRTSVSVVDLRRLRARAGGNLLPEERRHGGRVLALQIKSVLFFPPSPSSTVNMKH